MKVANTWPFVKIAEIAEKVAMGPFGSDIKVDCFVSEGVPVINGAHLHQSRLTEKSFNYVTEAKADQLRGANAFRGDIVITHRGTLGQVSLIPENSKHSRYVISQSQFKLTCKKEIMDATFLTYFFNSRTGQHKLLSNKSQTGVPAIAQPVTTLKMIEVPVPSLPEQRAIAAILSALDDKIELNRQMNKTLEEMAQAIFKEWFVDFGPFRDGGMQDSELGPIPVGWEIGKAEDFFDISIGKTPPRKEAQWFSTNDNDIKWVSISDMGRSGLFILNTSEYLTQEAIDKHHVKIVPANTVLLSFKLTVGRVSITSQEMTTNEAIAHFNTNMGNVNEFLFYYLKNFNFDSLGNTSSIANAVNSKVIKAMPILMPDEAILEAYHVLISSFFAEIKRNQEENCTLTAIRDTLLPKLMSGELRVPVSDNAG